MKWFAERSQASSVEGRASEMEAARDVETLAGSGSRKRSLLGESERSVCGDCWHRVCGGCFVTYQPAPFRIPQRVCRGCWRCGHRSAYRNAARLQWEEWQRREEDLSQSHSSHMSPKPSELLIAVIRQRRSLSRSLHQVCRVGGGWDQSGLRASELQLSSRFQSSSFKGKGGGRRIRVDHM